MLTPDGDGGTDIRLSQPPGRYLSGTYTSTIILNNVAYNNSATVTSSGPVTVAQGDGVINQIGSSGTLANFGRVTASAGASHGIYLASGGLVTNIATGSTGGYIAGVAAALKPIRLMIPICTLSSTAFGPIRKPSTAVATPSPWPHRPAGCVCALAAAYHHCWA